ncbi:MAG: hypothetical protein JW773_06190 [Desulfuromonadales bacterium]|nr:hypothetical protein [Desulfuromonadales bacterium]
MTDNRFIAILKEVSGAVMDQIKTDGVTGQKTTHQDGNGDSCRQQQQMNVIIEQSPGVTVR